MASTAERAKGMAQAAGLAHRAFELLSRIDTSLLQIARQTQTRADNALAEGANHGSASVGQGGITNNGWNGPHLVDANPERRGLEIRNTGAQSVCLGLGQNSPTFGAGIVLAPFGQPGSTWDGRISGAVWKGSVTPVAAAGQTSTIAFVEV